MGGAKLRVGKDVYMQDGKITDFELILQIYFLYTAVIILSYIFDIFFLNVNYKHV